MGVKKTGRVLRKSEGVKTKQWVSRQRVLRVKKGVRRQRGC